MQCEWAPTQSGRNPSLCPSSLSLPVRRAFHGHTTYPPTVGPSQPSVSLDTSLKCDVTTANDDKRRVVLSLSSIEFHVMIPIVNFLSSHFFIICYEYCPCAFHWRGLMLVFETEEMDAADTRRWTKNEIRTERAQKCFWQMTLSCRFVSYQNKHFYNWCSNYGIMLECCSDDNLISGQLFVVYQGESEDHCGENLRGWTSTFLHSINWV